MNPRLRALLTCAVWVAPNLTLGAPPEVRFYRDVRPILSNHCFRCHGPDAEKREAELRLDTRQGLLGATVTGKATVVPGDPAASELYRRITAAHTDEQMPPAEANVPLSPAQIDVLRRWIENGAQWQEHWAYAALVRPAVPQPSGASPADSPIDRFILARLERDGLDLSAAADPITLARRLSLDLTGLPPGPAEAEAVASNASGSNYAEFVERLLASAHYGERMAVYWLDLVRYADSGGYHSDVDQPISPYRDYVIAAFNNNLPFDQFTREQLAGDLLSNPTIAQRIATGYNRLNKTTEEGGAQAGEYLAKSAADRVRTTTGVWLAATLGCAECHDHKYDPFTARDFYSFAAFFADVKEQGVYSAGGRAPELQLPSPNQSARMAELEAEAAEVESRVASLTELQAGERPALEARAKELATARAQLEKSFPRTMITVSVPPREMRVLPRGNWLDSSGARVEPALPAFLAVPASPRGLTRLDLAEWLVARDNPLTARVFVNRLWKLFFGTGLSKSLDDLGAQGEPPTHPELLDWLAIEFMESGWDVKHMVRLLVNTRAFRQTSVPSAELITRDPANRLFARQGRWRLEAEFIRDAALVISKQLVRRIGGPSVKPYQPDGYWEFLNFPKRDWKADRGSDQYRRGLYTHWQRTFLHPSLLAFDAPSREECAADRPISNTPQAALVLLNDPTYVECARVFAERTLAEGGADDAGRIAWAWREALSRAPNPRESALLHLLLAENRARFEADEPASRSLTSVGQAPLSGRHSPAEIAAWTSVTRAILNLHETVSRN